jgi:hypothetical protein
MQTYEIVQSTPSPNTAQPPTVLQAPQLIQARRRYSIATIILLSIVVLLVIIGGSGLVYYAAVLHPNELHAQATAVAGTVFTTQAQGTAEARVRATATFAAMTPGQIYTWATSGTPVINDSLSDKNASIWFQITESDRSCDFIGGAYHIKTSLSSSMSCGAYNSLFNNLAFQVQMTIIKGSAGGLAFHLGEGFYLFELGADGRYALLLGQTSGVTELTSGTSTVINQGLNQANVLTVVDIDGQIYLYINKQPLTHLSDYTYNSGQLALFGASNTGPTDVAFNNAQVWSL